MLKGIWSTRSTLLVGIAFSAGLAIVPGAARAAPPETLTQALVEAYENNATLQQQRASLRATDEGVPTALSGWRPTVAFTEFGGADHGERDRADHGV